MRRHALACVGMRWRALACIGTRWYALACTAMRWRAAACIDMRWHALLRHNTTGVFASVAPRLYRLAPLTLELCQDCGLRLCFACPSSLRSVVSACPTQQTRLEFW
eukprot:2540283-Pyramimonas_sp.AAC.1